MIQYILVMPNVVDVEHVVEADVDAVICDVYPDCLPKLGSGIEPARNNQLVQADLYANEQQCSQLKIEDFRNVFLIRSWPITAVEKNAYLDWKKYCPTSCSRHQ